MLLTVAIDDNSIMSHQCETETHCHDQDVSREADMPLYSVLFKSKTDALTIVPR